MLFKCELNGLLACETIEGVVLGELESIEMFFYALNMSILIAIANANRRGVSDFLVTGGASGAKFGQESIRIEMRIFFLPLKRHNS